MENQFGFGVQWHLTDVCDQRCKHCYVWQTNEGRRKECLNSEQCRLVVRRIQEFGDEMDLKITLALTGGDPLLFPFFWEVAEMVNDRGWEWIVLGNPFHLDFDVASRLKELGCSKYQMSIDGVRSTHDAIRRKGSFDATLEKIALLKDVGITSLIMTTVSGENIDEIPELTGVCVDNGADLVAFARYGGNSGNGIHPLRYRKFLGDMYEIYMKLQGRGSNFSYKDHLWKLFFVENGLVSVDNSNSEVVDGCNCGFRHISVLPNGDAYACRRFQSHVGNVINSNLVDIFLSEEMEEYRQIEEMECSKCELFLYCRGCPSVSYGEYGDWKRRDPQCWKGLL